MEIRRFFCDLCHKISNEVDKPLVVYEMEISRKQFSTLGGIKDCPSDYRWVVQCCEDCIVKFKTG